jgi:hypothetical protein
MPRISEISNKYIKIRVLDYWHRRRIGTALGPGATLVRRVSVSDKNNREQS